MHQDPRILAQCKKIAIIGSPGSGKTTLAAVLSQKYNLPVYHLDRYQWESGWVKRDRQLFVNDHAEICAKDSWIIDGCGVRLLFAERAQHADAIIFLDLPRYLCLWRVFKRWWQTRLYDRSDVPAGCRDRLSAQLFMYVWNYTGKMRTYVAHALTTVAPHKPVFVLRSAHDVRKFIEQLSV